MKLLAGVRQWSGYAPLNCLKAYAGGGVKSGEAVHLDSSSGICYVIAV